MAIHVINKVNSRLRFLYRRNKILDIPLRRLLYNAMIQPFFDYACNTWHPNLNKNLKTRLQAAQNKCIRFCLKLGDRKSITVWKNLKKQIGCQFANGSINAYFLVFINFMKKSTQLYRWNFLPCRVQRNSYTLPLSKAKVPSSQNKSRFKSFVIYLSLIME